MGPVIKVTPETSRIDAPIQITAAGLVPRERVTIRTRVVDGALREWESVAIVDADGAGAVDLSRMAPCEGSTYLGVDGQGLLWSMKGPDQSKFFTRNLPVELEYRSELLRGDSVIASAHFRRHFGEDVTYEWVHEPPVVGTFAPTMGCRIRASCCCTALSLPIWLPPPRSSHLRAIPSWPLGGSGVRIVLRTWSTLT